MATPCTNRPRAARALALGLCLSTALAITSCSSSGDGSATASTGNGVIAPASQRPTAGALASPTPESAGHGLGTPRAPAPTVSAAAPWTPPDLKFYNEDYSVWYQDDSVVNTDAVTEHGNIEGYRTYSGSCIGYETRDISPEIHGLGLDDDTMSASLVEVRETTITNYAETNRTTLSLVRDDGGTMEGYSITWSGVFTYDDGTSENVEGYHFARAVGEAGLEFSVLAMCQAGHSITPEQWHTILSGIRIEGLSAGTM